MLNMPQLDFFKKFIEDLGGKVPEGEFYSGASAHSTKPESAATPETPPAEPVIDEDSESDIELDTEGCVPPDSEEAHSMGDISKTVTEDETDKASELRGQAAAAYSDQDFEKAIKVYTEAIEVNPHNALFFAKRGQAFLKLTKPNACIRDCNRALELNCDSAAAYKFRGRANRLLGNWEDAAKDLRQACKLDFDEETDEWLREVTPNAKKLEQHKVKQERKQKERELKQKQERVRLAQEANRRANEERSASGAGTGMPGFGAGMPGFGGAGGGGAGGFGDFLGKMGGADIMNDFNDPEIMAALTDIMSNPANISKYKDNPKIMKLIAMVKNASGGEGMGGFGGGGAGGAGGFPGMGSDFGGFGGGAPPPPSAPPSGGDNPKTNLQDEDLD